MLPHNRILASLVEYEQKHEPTHLWVTMSIMFDTQSNDWWGHFVYHITQHDRPLHHQRGPSSICSTTPSHEPSVCVFPTIELEYPLVLHQEPVSFAVQKISIEIPKRTLISMTFLHKWETRQSQSQHVEATV